MEEAPYLRFCNHPEFSLGGRGEKGRSLWCGIVEKDHRSGDLARSADSHDDEDAHGY